MHFTKYNLTFGFPELASFTRTTRMFACHNGFYYRHPLNSLIDFWLNFPVTQDLEERARQMKMRMRIKPSPGSDSDSHRGRFSDTEGYRPGRDSTSRDRTRGSSYDRGDFSYERDRGRDFGRVHGHRSRRKGNLQYFLECFLNG